jgi:hypothetical protein
MPALSLQHQCCLSVCLMVHPVRLPCCLSVHPYVCLSAPPSSWLHQPKRGENGACCHCQRQDTRALIIETNGIQLVLFGMQNWAFGPYLAAIHRIFIPMMPVQAGTPVSTHHREELCACSSKRQQNCDTYRERCLTNKRDGFDGNTQPSNSKNGDSFPWPFFCTFSCLPGAALRTSPTLHSFDTLHHSTSKTLNPKHVPWPCSRCPGPSSLTSRIGTQGPLLHAK